MTDRSRITCPYSGYPSTSYWNKSVANPGSSGIDPIVKVPFTISKLSRIATAGSCFAQHIARYLSKSGYTYLVTEDAIPNIIPESIRAKYNYGTFTARFGNIYTTRQLLQLFLRAYSEFVPEEEAWIEDQCFVDPFRPAIQPGGFETLNALRVDRLQHFAAVRRMFEQAELFIFTLGLTEAWVSKRDGSVFPVCPGCGHGIFDPTKYEFHNFDYAETLDDLQAVIARIVDINPGIQFIVTVSPVPLIATASKDHVLSSTVYSKSVLRAVAGKLAQSNPRVAYFPSYEIITTTANCGRYFGNDLRSVTEEGVRSVMKVFFKHFAQDGTMLALEGNNNLRCISANVAPSANIAEAAAVVCEEELLLR